MALPYIPSDPRAKTFKKRTTLESRTNFEVQKHCGMPKLNVFQLLDILGEDLEPRTDRNYSIKPETKMIACLSFFRSGSFQYVEGTVGGISQSAMSGILEQFSSTICNKLAKKYINFPRDNGFLTSTKEAFFDLGLMPNVVGLIDGCHIPISPPTKDIEAMFVNRKAYHSINVQAVCSPSMSFLDAVVKFPGSSHDSYIWKHCGLRQRFLHGEFGESWLLGDSGYAAEPFLLTPVADPNTTSQRRYNTSHRKSRSLVERSFGLWKAKFRSMDKSGGRLMYTPQKCCKLIMSSMVLHNYCITNKIDYDEEELQFAANYVDDDMFSPTGLVEDTCGVVTRNNVIRNYFSIN